MNKPARIAVPEQTDFRARFTAVEFLRMCETGAFDDMKVELIEGELLRMNPPLIGHGRYQFQIIVRLASMVDERLLSAETGIILDDGTVVGCDAAILKHPVIENRMLVPEDVALVIEVAMTTLDKDLGIKRAAYARAGVPAYWIIDGQRGITHVFAQPEAGEYAEHAGVRFGQPLAIPDSDRTITLD